jgi:hypothetical protein
MGEESERTRRAARPGNSEAKRFLSTVAGITRAPDLTGRELLQKLEKAGISIPKKHDLADERTRKTVINILMKNPNLKQEELCLRLEQRAVPMPRDWHTVLRTKFPGSIRYRWTELSKIRTLSVDLVAYISRCRADAVRETRLQIFRRLVKQHFSRRKKEEQNEKKFMETFLELSEKGVSEEEMEGVAKWGRALEKWAREGRHGTPVVE